MGAQTRRKSVMSKIILVTGASSGFGRLTAEALAKAGHTVYASMRETTGWNAPEVAKVAAFSQAHDVDLRTVGLDVLSQDSVDAAVAKVIVDTGHIDVLVHNAGTWCSARPRPSRRSSSPSYMTSTCSAPSG